MLDFQALGNMAETIGQATRDIDRHLDAIETHVSEMSALLAVLVMANSEHIEAQYLDYARQVIAQGSARYAGTAIFAPPEGDHYAGMPGDDQPPSGSDETFVP